MRNFFWKRSILACLLFCASVMMWSCNWLKGTKLEAEVKVANKSIYVWNRGPEPWTGGVVFLNERSLGIQKPFKIVNPGGFAQLPIREFRQGGRAVPEGSLQIRFVWVEVEGYAPRKFSLE